ncbi:keratinocyte proline-rich protein-like [Macrobrachium rosenbergii]|uniref:keratinocyte proline-rich protein-like n=1 Tax=Macrobrachium rosenbergii TaxID=79674 RepID=UPI0034D5088A
MILPTVRLRVTRPHASRIYNLAIANSIPGGYDLILGQDFPSPSKLKKSRGPNSPNKIQLKDCPPPRSLPDPVPVPSTAPAPVPRSPLDLPPGDPENKSQSLPVPLERTEQCQAPSSQNGEKIPKSMSVPVPVPRHQINPPLGDPKINSKSLPALLDGTEQCPSPSVSNDEKPLGPSLVPGPALVPVPEHAHELHSRDPSPEPLPPPGLAPLPMPVREAGPPDHSGSLPKGVASQPVPELVIPTW